MRMHHPDSPVRKAGLLVLAVGLLLAGAGCKSIGPGTVARDRYDYSSAISESWKRQTLLNIVKLRYLDPPIFVDVGQIVAGYSLETGLNVGGQVSSSSAVQGNSLFLGGQGKFTDRPTITYTPLTGNQFIKALMTPLPPDSVFFMIESGWPADAVLMAAAGSINGLKNQLTSLDTVIPPEEDFLRVLELLRQLQLSGAVSLRVKSDTPERPASILTLRATDIDEASLANARELRERLRLDPEVSEFALVFGGLGANNREVAVITRSILHIMNSMAARIEVPAEDVAQGRATPGSVEGGQSGSEHALLRIHCTDDRPEEAAVAVFYRERWFWIDDRDLRSKRAFSFMLMLFTLADTGAKEPLPLITIPTQ